MSDKDIRYRVEDADLDARLKRAHEMLKKYKANAVPKEASEKIATEIAKAKKLDPTQADEKIEAKIARSHRPNRFRWVVISVITGMALTVGFLMISLPRHNQLNRMRVGDIRTYQYHTVSCRVVKKISAERTVYFYDSKQAAEYEFKACPICHRANNSEAYPIWPGR